MHMHHKFGWVRAAGLVAALGLVACDSGTPTDAKKADPAKAVTEVKAPVPAPEPAKTTPTPADVKAVDPAAPGETKPVGDPPPATDVKAADAAGTPPATDAKAADTKAADAKAADAKSDTKSASKAPPKEDKAPAIDAKPLYDKHCKVCHAPDGKGTEAQKKNNIPDMTDAGWQGKHNKAKVIAAITNGIDGTKMKSFKDKLKPEEIDAVAAFVKKMK
jgi:mono/diheme cytochrome c family protein